LDQYHVVIDWWI